MNNNDINTPKNGLSKLVFTKDEAAQALGVKKSTIDYLVRTKKLSHRKISRFIRFTQEDLDCFIESSKRCNPCAAPIKRKRGDA